MREISSGFIRRGFVFWMNGRMADFAICVRYGMVVLPAMDVEKGAHGLQSNATRDKCGSSRRGVLAAVHVVPQGSVKQAPLRSQVRPCEWHDHLKGIKPKEYIDR